MYAMSDTEETVQPVMSWLNALACWNMALMFVTCPVFHEPISWLNAVAPANMCCIVVTSAVFHEPMSWLKAPALWNIACMVVTIAVFHEPIGWLNSKVLVTTPPHELSPVGQWRNNSVMSVTSDTSHSGISTQPALPHRAELGSAQFVSVEQHASPLGTAERHALTASLSAAVSGNEHIVSPEDGSSPASLIPPPRHGTHQPDCTR